MSNSNASESVDHSKVLIIVPAYNEQECIVETVEQVRSRGYHYVVINDGSTDRTAELCRLHKFNVVDLPLNLGIGGAVQTGHKHAHRNGYSVVVQFDGDGQHDIEYVDTLLNAIANGADLAIGSRFLSNESEFKSTALRRVGISWLSFWMKVFTGKRFSDPTSGFRAAGEKAIALFCRSYPVDYPEPESIVEACKKGLRIVEAPVSMNARTGGASSIGKLSSVYYMVKVSLAIALMGLSRHG